MSIYIFSVQFAFSFFCATVPRGKQVGQPGVGRQIGGVDQQRGTIHQFKATSGNQLDAPLLCSRMRPNYSGQGIAISNRYRWIAQGGCLTDYLLRVRSPPKKTEIGGNLKFSVSHDLL